MKINIIYPNSNRKKIKRGRLLEVLRWPFLGVGIVSVIVNLIVGKPMWSFIVVMALLMIWSLIFDVDLVEYNRLSQFSKFVIYSLIILILIDLFLAPGLAQTVIGIVSFSSLLVAGILFFSDIKRQKQNMMPLLVLDIFALIGTVLWLTLYEGRFYWTYIVMGSISILLIILFIIVLRWDFIKEFRKRFHL